MIQSFHVLKIGIGLMIFGAILLSQSLFSQVIYDSSSFSYSSVSSVELSSEICIAVKDELSEAKQYAVSLIRMDESLNALPIAQMEFYETLGPFYGVAGHVFEIDGHLEYAGAALKRQQSDSEPSAFDSVFFVHATWTETCEQVDTEIRFLRTGYAYPIDVVYHSESNGFHIAFIGFGLEYWLTKVNRESYSPQSSENRVFDAAIVQMSNPHQLNKQMPVLSIR